MRGIFWRVLALALAAVIAWLLWHWPEEPEPFELEVDQLCNLKVPHHHAAECWDGERMIRYPPRADEEPSP